MGDLPIYEATIFRTVFDRATDKKVSMEGWPKFLNLLEGLSREPGKKPPKGSFEAGTPLISPASYAKGTTRANANVLRWACWAALDVDDYEGSLEGLTKRYGDYEAVFHSTASSTPESLRFRVIVPLDKPVLAKDIPHFWTALNSEFLGIGDAQTKDLSRMFYAPATYPGANNFFIHRKGPKIDPSAIMDKFPVPKRSATSFLDKLSPEARAQIVETRKKQAEKQVTWNTYKDCPYVNKNLVLEYMAITGTGWYRKLYSIMCSVASNAIRDGYPITAKEIAEIAKAIDADNGGWYKNRGLVGEAERAIAYAYSN